jgi:acyl-CoA synthetase (NDP forming)
MSGESLERLFRPRSVVLVGASDKSLWSQLLDRNFVTTGFAGPVYLVNKRGAAAHGRPAHTSCRELPEVPDLAYVFVPGEAVAEAVEDAAAAGVRFILLLTSGFAEAGEDGRGRQEAIVKLVRSYGATIMGPNCLGFVNYTAGIAVTPMMVVKDPLLGAVSIVSQSGQTAAVLADFAQQQGIGISHVIASGNEADLDTARIVDHLLDGDETRVVVMFVESIRDPARFKRIAREARERKKALVVLKVGRTPLSAKLAQAHTGSVTGDDRIFDAVCRQYNVVRVSTPEDAIVTAGLLAQTGPISGSIAAASISGGGCEIMADCADTVGLDLPPFSEATAAKLRAVASDYGAVINPLDVTGAAVRDPALFEKVLRILAEDPGIGFTACIFDLARTEADFCNEQMLGCIGRGLAACNPPGVLMNQSLRPVTAHSRGLMARCGIPQVVGGIDHAVRALKTLVDWSAGLRAPPPPEVPAQLQGTARPQSEFDTIAYLADRGVPVVPMHCARTAAEAARFAESAGGPVALKIASPDIQHKSDIGGVRLGVQGGAAAAVAFDGIMQSVRAAKPDARIDGCIVAPMRSGGVELFVGIARSQWGPVIVAGLGGVFMEVLADTSMRLLPITASDARQMLEELRGRKLLYGYRGAPAVDLDVAGRALQAIGDAALALGPDLVALEVNPLFASGERIEALDALAVWDDRRAG